MRTTWTKLFFVGAFSIASCLAVRAQEVVHALTGVVTSVNKINKSISVQASDGSGNVFSYGDQHQAKVDLDKAIRSEATDPDVYSGVGDHAIVYYYIENNQQTVVAIKDIGKAPLQVSTGTVIDGDRKHHTLTIKTAAGASESYQIAKDTSIETPEGIIDGLKFDPSRNTRVTVKYSDTKENRVAQFVRED